LRLLLLLVFSTTPAETQQTKDCFLYDGNIFVVFIGALECERVWEDDHLKIIIVLENYVRANASSFKEDDEEEHD
jgi:hypothetical protein